MPLFFIFPEFAYKRLAVFLFVNPTAFAGVVFAHIFPLMGINVLNAPTAIILFCAEIFVVNMVKNIMFFVCVVSLIIVGPKNITPRNILSRRKLFRACSAQQQRIKNRNTLSMAY